MTLRPYQPTATVRPGVPTVAPRTSVIDREWEPCVGAALTGSPPMPPSHRVSSRLPPPLPVSRAITLDESDFIEDTDLDFRPLTRSEPPAVATPRRNYWAGIIAAAGVLCAAAALWTALPHLARLPSALSATNTSAAQVAHLDLSALSPQRSAPADSKELDPHALAIARGKGSAHPTTSANNGKRPAKAALPPARSSGKKPKPHKNAAKRPGHSAAAKSKGTR